MWQKIKDWFEVHKTSVKKCLFIGAMAVVVIAVAVACSSFGDVEEVQFGLTNSVNKEVSK